MIRQLLVILCLFSALSIAAQPYGNEWIDYSRPYYKLSIVEDGVYRLTYNDLLAAAFPLSTVDPRGISIYARGKEIPIFVSGELDGIFNPNDFIEFYAEANDGWLDTALYGSRDQQPNPYYSLINDTASYFLTYDNSSNHLRVQEENRTNFSSYFPALYVWDEELLSFNNQYYDGATDFVGATDVEYVPTEGWMSSDIRLGNNRSFALNAQNRYTTGPTAELEINLCGQSNFRSITNDHHLQITIATKRIDTIFEGYALLRIKEAVSPSTLVNGNNTLNIRSVDDLGSSVDRTSVGFIKLTYPHNMNFEGKTEHVFYLDDNSTQDATYINPTNFNGGSSPILYDVSNGRRVLVVNSFSGYRAIVPNSGGRKKCIMLNPSEIKSILKIERIGTNGFFTDYSAVALDSAYLMISHPSIDLSVNNYKAYRDNGGFNPMVINVEELYDQFAFGVRKHPLSIRNFVDNALDNWNTPPQYLFLLGKSISAKNHRNNDSYYQRTLVPTMGNPATDNLLTAGLNGTRLEVAVPTGRIAANNNDEVELYLDKIRDYEAAQPAKWMKQGLHFVGGTSLNQSNTFARFLDNYASVFSDVNYGGSITTFRKTTSDPIQTTLSDSIRQLVNEGVSLMTFFGHASASGGFDINIDNPANFQNGGRYPVFIGNACFSGDYHQPAGNSTSEQFVLIRDKAAIAFIASVNLSIASSLNSYSGSLYTNFSGAHYGRSLAFNMQQTVKAIQGNNPSGALKSVCLEMSLHGDPALVLNAEQHPDYRILSSGIRTSPQDVTTEINTFDLELTIENIGRAIDDSLTVQIIRHFPNPKDGDTTFIKRIPAVKFESEVFLTLEVDRLKGVGTNRFEITLDPFNQIPELSDLNNKQEFNLLIRSGVAVPVHPYPYAIVGQQAPTLKSSTAFAFEQSRNYVMELDTTDLFNGPFKQTQTLTASGGVIKWQPPSLQNMPDSAVYFWRISKEPEPGGTFDWQESSFQYIPGKQGWAQDHFFQFDENEYLFLQGDRASRRMNFVNNVKELYVYNQGNPNSSDWSFIRYQVDSDVRERNACQLSPAFHVAVLDSLTLESWETPYFGQNPNNDFDQLNKDDYCAPNRNRPEKYFVFQQKDSMQMAGMTNMLNNAIDNSHYVLIYSWYPIDFDDLRLKHPAAVQAIANLGFSEINTLSDSIPFAFSVKKGFPNTIAKVVGDSINQSIELKTILTTRSSIGTIKSTSIGPASSWQEINWRQFALESNSADSASLDVIGVTEESEEFVLFSLSDEQPDSNISQYIFDDFPLLKLRMNASDETAQTAPQLARWEVNYTPLPDAAINPALHFVQSKDSLNEGEILEVEIAIENVSENDMDSLLVSFGVLDADRQFHALAYPRQQPLKADSILIAKIQVPTFGFRGRNSLLIEVNPNEDQQEQFQFNNFGQVNFFVDRDRTNPLLDVTFDGRHILNGEIVSPQAEIVVRLSDENPYLALDDTSFIAIYVTPPSGDEQRINFGQNVDSKLTFIPAAGKTNQASVIYQPNFVQDGTYRLRVQAADKSGNASGAMDYLIEFEVISRSTITHLLNYPNPFSTSTRFVFTLTGSKVPEAMQIQIMTVTGKVVKEIDMEELGPIRIGNNITDYAWDGRDEFGDRLANGVYLYRVRTKLDGASIEHRESGADQFFKQQFGKMYLMR